ncbi:MAG: carboxymuconolactone decarboxylase family protein [Methylococcales bacterium]|nr:carboxymuconolactone decarboxylase family protein [Methylococcales bacterium]
MSYFPIMSEEKFEHTFPEIHLQVCNELGMGFVPDIFRCVVLIRKELAQSSWEMVRNNLCKGNLPRITKELMFSFIAHKRNCTYCAIAHQALAIHHGFTSEDIKTIQEDFSQVKNLSLRTVLKFASYSVDNEFSMIGSLYSELKALGFSSDEIAELIGMVSCSLYMVNIADSLGVKADKKFIDTIEQATIDDD